MSVFEDASALVTRYVADTGRDTPARSSVVVISAVSQVEVASAIWRKQRMGELSPSRARVLVDAFLRDLHASYQQPSAAAAGVTYLPVAPSTVVLDDAVDLVGIHGLRAYDAVQLASAVLARAADPTVSELITYDVALHRAAAAEGFTVNELP
jgi:predicted nucleic acid-binding protein